MDEDARAMEGGGQYPNYWSHKTRSGHSFIMDDSKGNETVTIQHRSGTAIQMRPDGGMLLTTHNGKYEVVLGEERVTISGASDITVKGDTSLRCYGDYNVTVHKDYNLTVLGNMNMTAKNMNRLIRGTDDKAAKTVNERVVGQKTASSASYSRTTTKGIASLVGGGGVQIAALAKDLKISTQDSSGNFITAAAGKMYQHSASSFHGTYDSSAAVGAVKGKYGAINPSDTTPYHRVAIDKSSGYSVITQGPVLRQAESHNYTVTGDHVTQSENHKVKAATSHSVTAGQNIIHTATSGSISHTATAGSVEMRAPSGSANFVGGTTNISSLSGLLGIAGSAGVALDSLGSMLNLNSGIAAIASALGISLPFDITAPTQADTPPSAQGSTTTPPTQEPDASSEIDSWL